MRVAYAASVLPLVLCTLQACGGDDSAATAPFVSSTDAGRTSDASPFDAGAAEAGFAPATAGTCGATTSSVRIGSTEQGSLLEIPDEGVGGVVVDGDALYVAGWRNEKPDGGADGSTASVTHWVAKFDATRTPVWQRLVGYASHGRGIALDGTGGVIVVGSQAGGLFTSDAFVAKLDATNGTETWHKTFGASGDDLATAVATKGTTTYATGQFDGTVSFGATSLTTTGKIDVFVATLDTDGNATAAFKVGGANDDVASSIAVAPDGDLVLGGASSDGMHFDGWVAKYSTAGELRWNKYLGAMKTGQIFAVTTDTGGSVYVAGIIDGKATVLKLDAGGNEHWAKLWGRGGTSGDVSPSSIVVAADGAVLVGGEAPSTYEVDFGGGPIGGAFEPAAFIVELEPSGKHRCSRSYPSSGPYLTDGGVQYTGAGTTAVAYTSATSYVAAGSFAKTLDLGKSPMTSAGDYDIFFGDFAR